MDEVMAEVLRDVAFYKNSGGGVTLSGGEPTVQPKFAQAILKRCKQEGIHTALDTCGYVRWPVLARLLEYTDLVLYDIKHLDPTKHREATGKDNSLILANARRVARLRPMRIRVPLIPGFNDSVEEVKKIASFVREELGLVDVDLLPYNKLGEGKYKRLDRAAPQLETQGTEYVEKLREAIAASLKNGRWAMT